MRTIVGNFVDGEWKVFSGASSIKFYTRDEAKEHFRAQSAAGNVAVVHG